MKNNGFVTIMMNIGNWIVYLAHINFMWLLHSLMGLFILGIFPATVALLSVIRFQLKHGNTTSIWNIYHRVFKKEFIKSNIVGFLYLIIGVITYADFKFIQMQDNFIFMTLSYTVLILLIIYGVIGLFLFPLFAHYDLSIKDYFKYAFFVSISNPINTILTLSILIVACIIMILLPGLILFYGASIPAYIMMWSAYRLFNKIDMKASVK